MKKKGNTSAGRAAGCYVSRAQIAKYKADEAFAQRMMQMNAMKRICGEIGFSNSAPSIGVDGYSNSAVSIGAASPLFSAGTFVRSGLSSDFQKLTTVYRESSLAMRIIDMPAEDMTRAGYTLTGDFEAEDLEELKRVEARHNIMGEITDAIRWARLYGGAIAVIDIYGDSKKMDTPLEISDVLPGSFQGLLVRDRTRVTPSLELEDDVDDPDYGLPMYYDVDLDGDGIIRVHHSRVLRFIGRELPQGEMIRENYWGASELEHIWDELQRYTSVSANAAELVFKANLSTLKMDGLGEMMSIGTDEAKRKTEHMMAEMTHMMSSFGLLMLNPDESLETHPYSFDGIKDMHEAFMTEVAGAAEIPATKLFGRSPDGMNATGEADMRNYYERIASLQRRMLRPALERLLPVLMMSCFLSVPENMGFVFNPLATVTPKETEELARSLSSRVRELFEAGIITREEARAELRGCGEKYVAWRGL